MGRRISVSDDLSGPDPYKLFLQIKAGECFTSFGCYFLMVKIFEHLDKYIIGIVWIIALTDAGIKLEKACCRVEIK